MSKSRYVIVEDAGGDNEREIAKFISYRQAIRYRDANYDQAERDRLNVDIMSELNGVRTTMF